MRLLPVAAAVAALVVWALMPSDAEPVRYVPNATDGESTPTMSTRDVSTLISDSGYTRYHLTADLWQMFEDAEEPFWKFPEGLEFEQYDTEMNPTATVICDSAVYYSRKRLWQLDGHVRMVNTEADTFLSNQLFWDQSARKMYSDSFIHIVRTDRIIEGYGFESDQSMLYYTVNRPTAILPAERMPGAKRAAAADSTGTSASAASSAGAHSSAQTDTAAPSAARPARAVPQRKSAPQLQRNDGLSSGSANSRPNRRDSSNVSTKMRRNL